MRKVSIKGVSYKLRYTLRSFFIYEQITGAPYDNDKLSNSYILLYSTLCACNRDFSLSFDDLIDECDADPVIFQEFIEMLGEEADRIRMLKKDGDDEKKKDV